MARIRLRQQAGPYERYASDAFEGMIGQVVPMDLQGVPLGDAVLIGAEVIEDGRAVWLEFELPGSFPAPPPSVEQEP